MGTPTPPNEPASGCALCFGVGFLLGEVQPKYVDVTISGCTAGGAINEQGGRLANGKYRLQHVTACVYRLNTFEFQVTLDWAVTRTRVFFILLGIEPTNFISLPGDICATSITGNAISTATKASIGGVAKITWSTEGL